MNEYYYYRLSDALEKARDNLVKFKKIRSHAKKFRELKKKVPDLKVHVDSYGNAEYRSEWVNKNWTHSTYGEGGCSVYYFRTYIIIDTIKVYSEYKAKLGYTEYHDYSATTFEDLLDTDKAIEVYGERARELLDNALERYHELYDEEDEDDYDD